MSSLQLSPIPLECVTRYEGNRSQKPDLSSSTRTRGSRSSSSTPTRHSSSSSTQRKGSQKPVFIPIASSIQLFPRKNESRPSSSTQRNESRHSSSTQRNESRHSSSTQRNESRPSSSTQRNESRPSSSSQRNESRPSSSSHRNESRPSSSRKGLQKPEPSSFTRGRRTQLSSPKGSQKPVPSSSPQKVECQRPSFGCGCGNCTFLSYIEHGCPEPIPKSTTFPCLNVSRLTNQKQKKLKTRLRVESQDIMVKFQQLLSTVYKSLCEQNIPVTKLVTHLLSLGALDPVSKESQKPLLQTFFQELRNAESIKDVLWVIRDYFSFFNYHVIEHIVDGLGTDQDKVELQNYKEHFHQYSKRRIFECPPDYGPMSSGGHADLVLKLDAAYEQFTVEELDNLECTLSRIFCVLLQSVLRLCRVEEGCLQLIFQVPSFVQQEIFPLSSEQESALAVNGVIRLTCGDYQFVAKVCRYCDVILCTGIVPPGNTSPSGASGEEVCWVITLLQN